MWMKMRLRMVAKWRIRRKTGWRSVEAVGVVAKWSLRIEDRLRRMEQRRIEDGLRRQRRRAVDGLRRRKVDRLRRRTVVGKRDRQVGVSRKSGIGRRVVSGWLGHNRLGLLRRNESRRSVFLVWVNLKRVVIRNSWIDGIRLRRNSGWNRLRRRFGRIFLRVCLVQRSWLAQIRIGIGRIVRWVMIRNNRKLERLRRNVKVGVRQDTQMRLNGRIVRLN